MFFATFDKKNSMHSTSEEDYLKAIFKLTPDDSPINTNAIADLLATKASSVTDMIKKLAEKKLVNYIKYQGVTLTEAGKKVAILVIRKHRLWETFLVEKLNFKWDEIHEVAEELEHIKNTKLIDRLDDLLGHPKNDPHGDPIPDKFGKFKHSNEVPLDQLKEGDQCVLHGVNDDSAEFLQYLDRISIELGSNITIIEKFPFDHSMKIKINLRNEINISATVSENLSVIKEGYNPKKVP